MDWQGAQLRLRLWVRGIWLHSGQCGLLLEVLDVVAQRNRAECPFATGRTTPVGGGNTFFVAGG
jgi:hypothetical protein